ncbi:hypothetical protein F4809DRAFT_658588 [Biscogniauxia mediterranea]|nr:hypothetical protein F4809DRAFT_658588 [Biscogniauxia mediterranea]
MSFLHKVNGIHDERTSLPNEYINTLPKLPCDHLFHFLHLPSEQLPESRPTTPQAKKLKKIDSKRATQAYITVVRIHRFTRSYQQTPNGNQNSGKNKRTTYPSIGYRQPLLNTTATTTITTTPTTPRKKAKQSREKKMCYSRTVRLLCKICARVVSTSYGEDKCLPWHVAGAVSKQDCPDYEHERTDHMVSVCDACVRRYYAPAAMQGLGTGYCQQHQHNISNAHAYIERKRAPRLRRSKSAAAR